MNLHDARNYALRLALVLLNRGDDIGAARLLTAAIEGTAEDCQRALNYHWDDTCMG